MLDTGQKTEDGRTNMLVDQPMNRRCELGVKRFEVGIWNGDGRTRRQGEDLPIEFKTSMGST